MIDEQTSTPVTEEPLTPEEKAAHDKAMQDEADAKQLVEKPTDEQKKSTIGLETGDGKYAYIPLPDETDYRSVHVVYSGHSYKHVATDKDGRWLYRQE